MSYVKMIRQQIGNQALFVPCSGVIIYQDNQILLQQRKDNGLWGLHGGALEIKETFLEAAQRELKEETGLIGLNFKPFKLYAGKDIYIKYPNGDLSYLINQVYILTQFEGNIISQTDEVLNLKWFKISELPFKEILPIDQIVLKDFIESIKQGESSC
ncbi:MAG: NUDIX domain-containing protein [Candidatus Phytoplasma sp.]|nr:NUDIX domain-containing protein [Phytoplasma sp.]